MSGILKLASSGHCLEKLLLVCTAQVLGFPPCIDMQLMAFGLDLAQPWLLLAFEHYSSGCKVLLLTLPFKYISVPQLGGEVYLTLKKCLIEGRVRDREGSSTHWARISSSHDEQK